MRLDRPIGTWLLLFPCWWSITMAAGTVGLGFWTWAYLMVIFGIGALVMRGAGCTVNDILDRDIDGKVARTAGRPIASGQISAKQAVAFLGLELAIGFLVLVQLNKPAVMVGLLALLLVGVYPLMKRLTYWPQAWLGITFNWGALLGWAAVTGGIQWPPVMLYLAGILWTLGYDTIYAHQDKEDDVMLGVKSSALALGTATKPFAVMVYAGTIALTMVAGNLAGLAWWFYPAMLVAGAQLMWQAFRVNIDDGEDCLRTFKSNRIYGWLTLAAILLGHL
jgi:4-hydroxybenzoate polyprenyltransferase